MDPSHPAPLNPKPFPEPDREGPRLPLPLKAVCRHPSPLSSSWAGRVPIKALGWKDLGVVGSWPYFSPWKSLKLWCLFFTRLSKKGVGWGREGLSSNISPF